MIKISNVLVQPLCAQDNDGALDLLGEDDILVHTVEITPEGYPGDNALFHTKVLCMLYTDMAAITVEVQEPWVMWNRLLPMSNFVINYQSGFPQPRLWLISFQHEQPSFLRFACVLIEDPTHMGLRGGKSVGAASIGKGN